MSRLERGDRILITGGAYKGYEGVVTEAHGGDRPDYSVTLDNGDDIYVHNDHAARR